MDRIQELTARPSQYSNIDGTEEFSFGFFFLCFSIWGVLQSHIHESLLWWNITTEFFVVAIGATLYFGAKALKNRVTYRRTGFVEYRKRGKKKLTVLLIACSLLAAVIGAAFCFLALRGPWRPSWVFLVMGVIFPAAYIRFARHAQWKWAIFLLMFAAVLLTPALPAELLSAVGGGASPLARLGIYAKDVGAFWLTYAINSALFAISGGITFWLYLCHTQAPEQESE
jgi:hypothetical protein